MEAGPGSSKDRSSKFNIIRTAVARIAEARIAMVRIAEARIAMVRIAEARIALVRITMDSGIIMLTRRNIRP